MKLHAIVSSPEDLRDQIAALIDLRMNAASRMKELNPATKQKIRYQGEVDALCNLAEDIRNMTITVEKTDA